MRPRAFARRVAGLRRLHLPGSRPTPGRIGNFTGFLEHLSMPSADDIGRGDIETLRKFAARCRSLSASAPDWKAKVELIALAIDLDNEACEIEAERDRRSSTKE